MLSPCRIARGPSWVPVRPVAVPSHGAPPTATSTFPARRSSGVRQTGAFMNVWIPLHSISEPRRLTYIGPGGRRGSLGVASGVSGMDPRIRDGRQSAATTYDHDIPDI